jgi:malto-oligosyltrehalose trehalohydrolase
MEAAPRRGICSGLAIASLAAIRFGVFRCGMTARFGAQLHPEGTTFRLWAPAAKGVELMLDRPHPMPAGPEGWYEITIPGTRAGTLYRYRIDGELAVPDPASHFQPLDVSGPSEVIDHDRFVWRAREWRGRPWEEAVILEVHVGTFTAAGTFRSAIEKLDHVVETGFTAIQLMPVADFAGRRNWGYDGVLLYAPDNAYGRPDDLRAVVDEAHARGLMVFLDVVYNHFGPEGNYLNRYAPTFFAPAHTPWGSAIDYRVPQVRAFAVGNALHWLEHYRFDGLRLDAVHAIVEPGQPSILHDLSRVIGHFSSATGRMIHLVIENDDNRASLLDPRTNPPQGKYRAQWNDDYHHAWHVLLTREQRGYYRDYAADPIHHLARVLSSGFAYQGETSAHRTGRPRGELSGLLSPLAFVDFLQNHDQIGNRPLGNRLTSQVNEAALAAALAVTLLAPMPPLLFMGEEWGSTQPFPFFCDFQGALADAVRNGRREEFKQAYDEPFEEMPDPLSEGTFRSAVLDWDARTSQQGSRRLALVRDLLAIRRSIAPQLATAKFGSARREKSALALNWSLSDGKALTLLANLSHDGADLPSSFRPGRPLWGGKPTDPLSPWAVFWSTGEG